LEHAGSYVVDACFAVVSGATISTASPELLQIDSPRGSPSSWRAPLLSRPCAPVPGTLARGVDTSAPCYGSRSASPVSPYATARSGEIGDPDRGGEPWCSAPRLPRPPAARP